MEPTRVDPVKLSGKRAGLGLLAGQGMERTLQHSLDFSDSGVSNESLDDLSSVLRSDVYQVEDTFGQSSVVHDLSDHQMSLR